MSDKLRFGEILVRAGVLQRAQLDTISAGLGARDDLGEQLVRQGIVNESRMLQAVGQALNLPTVVLTDLEPDARALALLPQAVCEEHRVFPVELERTRAGEHLHVAMANPSDIRAIKQITRRARRRIRPLVASARDIGEAIAVHYAGQAPSRSEKKRQSPVDMFDFSVTDLSSIEEVPAQTPQAAPSAPVMTHVHVSTPPRSAGPRGSASMPPRPPARPGSLGHQAPRPSGQMHRPPSRPSGHLPQPTASSDLGSLPPNSRPSGALDLGFDEPIDLSTISVEDADLATLDPEPVDLSAISVESAELSDLAGFGGETEISGIDSHEALLAGLASPQDAAEIMRTAEQSFGPQAVPPSAPPMRRAPPTSMPPRPSPESTPSRHAEPGFGMVRRTRRRGAGQRGGGRVDVTRTRSGEASRSTDRMPALDLSDVSVSAAPRAPEPRAPEPRAPAAPADPFLSALERALADADVSTSRLVLVLVRQLAAQGVLDTDAFIKALLRS